MVTREAEVLLLSRANFERLFGRKYGQTTIQELRERLKMRLYMYIHRSDSLHTAVKSSFFKYLIFLLQNENAVMQLRKQKQRDKEEKNGLRKQFEGESKYDAKEAEQVSGMLKLLDLDPKTTHIRLPTVESSQKVINEIEEGLNSWIERSRGGSGHNSPMSASPRAQRRGSIGALLGNGNGRNVRRSSVLIVKCIQQCIYICVLPIRTPVVIVIFSGIQMYSSTKYQ